MRRSLTQEFYKFSHQKVPYYGVIALLLLMLTTISKKANDALVVQGFGASEWVGIIIAILGTICFAMEYKNDTISVLFYKNLHRRQVYMAKVIVLVIYNTILILFSMLFTMGLKLLLVPQSSSWVADSHHLLKQFIKAALGNWSVSILVLMILVCLICLIRSSTVTMVLGLVVTFAGPSLSVLIIKMMGVNTGKWNVFNMMNLTKQLIDKQYNIVTHLSLTQISSGMGFYICFFLILGYIFFKKTRS